MEINTGSIPLVMTVRTGCLAFADDIILMAYMTDALQQMLDNVVDYLAELSLRVSPDKSQLITTSGSTYALPLQAPSSNQPTEPYTWVFILSRRSIFLSREEGGSETGYPHSAHATYEGAVTLQCTGGPHCSIWCRDMASPEDHVLEGRGGPPNHRLG